MNRISISPKELLVRPHHLWYHRSLLLTSGDFNKKDFNCMTVGWGSFGTMWSMPFVQVVVRPTRFTHQFMEKYPEFTVCAFGKEFQKDLSLLGSISGRDGNKLADTSLTPIKSSIIAAPGYAEAELIIECRKIFSSTFKPDEFIDPSIEEKYPQKDYHTVYYGRIQTIFGIEKYQGTIN